MIRVQGEAAVLAAKFGLAFSISLFAVATSRASTTGVTRINKNHGNTSQTSLVFHKRTKLSESPTAQSVSLLASHREPIANVLEILKYDRRCGCPRLSHDSFADAVVLIATEVCFPPAKFRQKTTTAFSSKLLDTGSPFCVVLPNAFNICSGEHLPCRISGNVDNAKINADRVPNFDGIAIRYVNCAEQIEFLVAINKIGLSFYPSLHGSLVLATDERYPVPTSQTPDTDFGQALEAQDSLVIANGRPWLENRADGFVTLEAFDSLGNCSDSHLGRQRKLIANSPVGEPMDDYLPVDASSKSLLGSECGGSVESLHSSQDVSFLVFVRQQLQLQNELHILSVSGIDPACKVSRPKHNIGGDPFLCQLKAGSFLDRNL